MINLNDLKIKNKICTCEDKDNCDCQYHISDEDKKKCLAVAGATVIALGVAGGIAYLVKNNK